MRYSFVHFGDVHLGKQQYNSTTRFNDFGTAWLHACNHAIEKKADFVVCSGDLFDRFGINPVTYDQAYEGLDRLREAGIPLVDIEGNHDRLRYGESKSWLHSLADKGFLYCLDVPFVEGEPRLDRWNAQTHRGSVVELGGCRIIGLKYLGMSTSRVIEPLARALDNLPRDGAFTLLVMHAGLEGIVPNFRAELSTSAIEPLFDRVNYIALGHIHKHYRVSNHAYNPGSLETWAANEWGWDRGILDVSIDTAEPAPVSVNLVEVPRRPFAIIRVDVAAFASPNELYLACWERVRAERGRTFARAPVVQLILRGRLRFDQHDLAVDRLELMLQQEFHDAVATMVREEYDVTDFRREGDDGDGPEGIDRGSLERSIIQARLAADSRYADQARDWANLAVELKEQALHGADGGALLATLRAGARSVQATADSFVPERATLVQSAEDSP